MTLLSHRARRTRADLLPPRVCHALARLHDRVRPLPASPLAVFAGAPASLLGAGSIACVYRVTIDGRDVAVKVRRPRIERSLNLDLAMLERLARILAELPPLRGVPVTGIATQLAESIRAQLDLTREADLLRDFRTAMANENDERAGEHRAQQRALTHDTLPEMYD